MNKARKKYYKFTKIVEWFGLPESPRMGRLWLLFFIYPAIVAVFVQFIILPYIFPDWHAGGGVLIQGDSAVMHREAVHFSMEIREQGWSAWKIAPTGIPLVGITSAIYASLAPELWILIPLSAALHATAAVVLLLLIKNLVSDWRWAFVAVLPFWLYPSAMNWYTQLHKDGFSIAGTYLFLYGLTLIIQKRTWKKTHSLIPFAFICISLGVCLTWIVRPYLVELLIGASLIAILMMLVAIRFQLLIKAQIRYVLLIIILVLLVSTFAYLPIVGLIEEMAQPFYLFRDFHISLGGFSAIDANVRFENIRDILSYIPRAAQITLLAPFPNMWFEQGIMAQTTFMRRIVAIEMVGIYICLLPIPIAMWRWRKKADFWLAFIFSFSIALMYSLVVNNMGALHRYRHGFIMIIVALGIAGFISHCLQGLKMSNQRDRISNEN